MARRDRGSGWRQRSASQTTSIGMHFHFPAVGVGERFAAVNRNRATSEGAVQRDGLRESGAAVPPGRGGMDIRLKLDIQRQPDETSCGPTCLRSIYRYNGDLIPLRQLVEEVPRLRNGGTLAVLMGVDALKRGYSATLYTYDLRMFDPSWFESGAPDLKSRLVKQARAKQDGKLHEATRATIEYLQLGGKILFEDLTANLLRRYLAHGTPILTGLSSTYLYRSRRERGWDDEEDDIRGTSAGHFVVLCGYDAKKREVLVADPLRKKRRRQDREYTVSVQRLIGAILLGVLSYDGNLLILEKKKG